MKDNLRDIVESILAPGMWEHTNGIIDNLENLEDYAESGMDIFLCDKKITQKIINAIKEINHTVDNHAKLKELILSDLDRFQESLNVEQKTYTRTTYFCKHNENEESQSCN